MASRRWVNFAIAAVHLVVPFVGPVNARADGGADREQSTADACDVVHTTIPDDHLPEAVVGWANLGDGVIGEHDLWVRRDQADEAVPTFDMESGHWRLKFPWYRVRPGRLRIEGQRVDGSGGFEADIPRRGAYADTGTLVTVLVFSNEGCWRVVGRLRQSKVVFYVEVGTPLSASAA